MKDTWLIFEIVINLVYGILFSEFITRYFKFKENIKRKELLFGIFACLLFIAITANNLYSNYEGFAAIIYGAITFVFAVLFLKGSIWQKLYITILEYGIFSIFATLTLLFISIIFSTETHTIIAMESNISRLLTIFIVIILYFAFTRLLLLYKKKNDEIKTKQWLILTAIPFISFLLMISIIEITINNLHPNFQKIYIVISIILILILNFIVFVFLSIISNNNKIAVEYELLKQIKFYEEQRAADIQKIYNTARGLKHDMKQHIENIFTQLNDIPKIENEELKKYTENMTAYLNKINGQLSQISTVIQTGNKALDNILNYKINIAKEHGIEVVTNIKYTILGISDIDLSILVGNLFDNAIEACEKLKNIEKKIYVKIFKNNLYLTISIRNPIETSVLEINKDLISTKKEKELHGMGIKSIKNIVKKYNGLTNYREEKNLIFAEIKLIERENIDENP